MSTKDPLEEAQRWIEAGHRVALATVIETWGSSPRPAGSRLAVRKDGLFEGSVSGGCIENDVMARCQQCMEGRVAHVQDYGISHDQAWAVGLACGGKMRVFIEELAGTEKQHNLQRLNAHRRARRRVALRIHLPDGTQTLHEGEAVPDIASPHLDGEDFVDIHRPTLRLIVVGAVHIAQFLVQMAQGLGFETVVLDPRQGWADARRFEGVDVRTGWPEEELEGLMPDPDTAIVVLTHDPKLDDPVLRTALASEAFYVGALGSTRTHRARCARLAEGGVNHPGIPAERLAKIHGPIGLDIGARSPGEIAVAILAEVLKERQL